jgi:Domain of unknown function (DUF397)
MVPGVGGHRGRGDGPALVRTARRPRRSPDPGLRLGVAWRTSCSGDNGGIYVEVGTAGSAVAVRDSKDPEGPQPAFAADTWQAFAEAVKADA